MGQSSPCTKHRLVSGPMRLTTHKPPQVAWSHLSSRSTDSGRLGVLPKATCSCCAGVLVADHGSACQMTHWRPSALTYVARCLRARVCQAVPHGNSKGSKTSLLRPWLELGRCHSRIRTLSLCSLLSQSKSARARGKDKEYLPLTAESCKGARL